MSNFLSEARKFLVALAAAVAVLGTVIPNGITSQEWISVILAFLGALGVYLVPNQPSK